MFFNAERKFVIIFTLLLCNTTFYGMDQNFHEHNKNIPLIRIVLDMPYGKCTDIVNRLSDINSLQRTCKYLYEKRPLQKLARELEKYSDINGTSVQGIFSLFIVSELLYKMSKIEFSEKLLVQNHINNTYGNSKDMIEYAKMNDHSYSLGDVFFDVTCKRNIMFYNTEKKCFILCIENEIETKNKKVVFPLAFSHDKDNSYKKITIPSHQKTEFSQHIPLLVLATYCNNNALLLDVINYYSEEKLIENSIDFVMNDLAMCVDIVANKKKMNILNSLLTLYCKYPGADYRG